MLDVREEKDPFAAAGSANIAGMPNIGPGLMTATQQMLANTHPGSAIPPGMPLATMQPTPTQPQPPVPGVRGGGISQPAQGEFATRSGNRRAGLNNLMGSVSRLIDRFSEHEEAKRVRSMSMDIQTLFSAITGMQQAQSSGDKESLQKNQQIINDILSDPKKQKSLQKAFDIQLFGKDKNKDSTERQSLMHAIQEWQKGGKQGLNPVAQQFLNKIPNTLQMNPQLAMMAQLVKANLIPGAKENTEVQKQTMQTLGEALKTSATIQQKQEAAKMLATVKDRETLGRYLGQIAATKGRLEAMKMYAASRVEDAKIRSKAMVESATWRTAGQITAAMMRSDTVKQSAGLNKAATGLKQEYDALDKQAQDLRQKIQGTSFNPWKMAFDKAARKSAMEFNGNLQLLDQVEAKQRQVINKINTLNGITGNIGENIVTGDENPDAGSNNANDAEFDKAIQQFFTEGDNE